jgi:hypothetical protein
MLIGYALAADHPDRVVRVALGEAPLPGITPPNPLVLPDQVVDPPLAHPVQPAQRRRTRSSSGDARTSSSSRSSRPRQGRTNCRTTPFGTTSTGLPRAPRRCTAASSSTARSPLPQRRTRSARPAAWRCPSWRWAEPRASDTMKLTADDVQTLVIPGIGHWLAEQAPEELLARGPRSGPRTRTRRPRRRATGRWPPPERFHRQEPGLRLLDVVETPDTATGTPLVARQARAGSAAPDGPLHDDLLDDQCVRSVH